MEMVYGLGGCPRTPSSLICSPAILESLEVQSHALSRPSWLVIELQFSHTQSLSMASKVMLVARALGSNIQCCLQVSGTKKKPVLMWHPIGALELPDKGQVNLATPLPLGRTPFLSSATLSRVCDSRLKWGALLSTDPCFQGCFCSLPAAPPVLWGACLFP